MHRKALAHKKRDELPRAIPKGKNLGGARRVKVEALCYLLHVSRTTLTPGAPP